MKNNSDISIKYVETADKEFWFSLDKHFSVSEFRKKVRDRQGYVLFTDNKPVGILRYNLFWDNTPFCTLLFIDRPYRKQGHGKAFMDFWENEMRKQNYSIVLVSTQADEQAQHFYRKIGYCDCGSLIVAGQATELFLKKDI